jgi:hypothetical protein
MLKYNIAISNHTKSIYNYINCKRKFNIIFIYGVNKYIFYIIYNCESFSVIKTPDDGPLRPKHVVKYVEE